MVAGVASLLPSLRSHAFGCKSCAPLPLSLPCSRHLKVTFNRFRAGWRLAPARHVSVAARECGSVGLTLSLSSVQGAGGLVVRRPFRLHRLGSVVSGDG